MPIPEFKNPQEWIDLLSSEALLLGLLSKILYTYPERNFYQALATEGVFSGSPIGGEREDVREGLKLLQRWSESALPELSDEGLKELEVDYTRLFIGIGPVLAAPWESVYFSEERLLFQDSTLDVRSWYRRFDLEAENLNREPDDHIGLEIMFLARLAQIGREAVEKNDPPLFLRALETQRAFMGEHLLTWVEWWRQEVLAHAETIFFKGIALLTTGVLNELGRMFDVKVTARERRGY